jgi:hypothetical protein
MEEDEGEWIRHPRGPPMTLAQARAHTPHMQDVRTNTQNPVLRRRLLDDRRRRTEIYNARPNKKHITKTHRTIRQVDKRNQERGWGAELPQALIGEIASFVGPISTTDINKYGRSKKPFAHAKFTRRSSSSDSKKSKGGSKKRRRSRRH